MNFIFCRIFHSPHAPSKMNEVDTDAKELIEMFSVSQHVGGHANLFLKLNETTPAPEKLWNNYPISDTNKAHLMGLATTRTILGNIIVACQIAHNDDGAVQWVGIDGGEKGGTILVSIDYINAELNPTSKDCPSCRLAHIQVNEAEKVRVEFPLSGDVCDILIPLLITFRLAA